MRKNRRISIPAFGGSSLLVIFAVLCLCIFALLGLSTAQAGERMSNSAAQAAQAYYAADMEAEKILALIRAGETPEGISCEGDIYSWGCPVSDRQSLEVSVRVSGTDFEVLRWQLVSTTDWVPDTSLNVWQGGELG